MPAEKADGASHSEVEGRTAQSAPFLTQDKDTPGVKSERVFGGGV